jgi:hypothetical protein
VGVEEAGALSGVLTSITDLMTLGRAVARGKPARAGQSRGCRCPRRFSTGPLLESCAFQVATQINNLWDAHAHRR